MTPANRSRRRYVLLAYLVSIVSAIVTVCNSGSFSIAARLFDCASSFAFLFLFLHIPAVFLLTLEHNERKRRFALGYALRPISIDDKESFLKHRPPSVLRFTTL